MPESDMEASKFTSFEANRFVLRIDDYVLEGAQFQEAKTFKKLIKKTIPRMKNGKPPERTVCSRK